MWLSRRNSGILSCLVQLYISQRKPVSSEKLSTEIGLSSSTIRKELQKMEDYGLVFKPGKSKGRVPTDKGLKHFSRELIKFHKNEKKPEFTTQIEGSDFKDLSLNLLSHLSQETSNLSFIFLNSIFDLNFRQVKLHRIAPHRVMTVIRSTYGCNFSKVFTTDYNYNETDLKEWEEILNREFKGKTLNNTLRILRNRLSRDREKYKQIYKGLYYLLYNNNLLTTELITKGNDFPLQSGVPIFQDIRKVFEKPELLEERERLSSFLNDIVSDSSKDAVIAFGKDTGIKEMQDVVLISSNYFFSEKPIGNLGIIGPKFMNYLPPLNSVEQFSACFSRILSQKNTEA